MKNAWSIGLANGKNIHTVGKLKTSIQHRTKISTKKTRRLARSSLAILVQVITGQNNLNYLTNIIFPQLTDQCRFCEEEQETFIHLLNECPVVRERRTELFSDMIIENSLEWDPARIVEFAQHPQIEEALASRSNE